MRPEGGVKLLTHSAPTAFPYFLGGKCSRLAQARTTDVLLSSGLLSTSSVRAVVSILWAGWPGASQARS